MASKTAIGKKILLLRKELGLTQGELASKVGVSRAAISQFELGDITPSHETQQKLSEALNFNLTAVKNVSLPSLRAEIYNWKNADREEYLPYLPITSYPTLVAVGGIYLGEISNENEVVYTTARVPVLPGFDYENACVVEVNGNSMSPRYPHQSQYVVAPISPTEEEIRLLSGVCLFFIPYKQPIFRRVISNKGGVLTLRADLTGEEFEMNLSAFCCGTEADSNDSIVSVYKLGQAVHMPIE